MSPSLWYARLAQEAPHYLICIPSFETNAAGVVSRTRVVSTRKVLGELLTPSLIVSVSR